MHNAIALSSERNEGFRLVQDWSSGRTPGIEIILPLTLSYLMISWRSVVWIFKTFANN